jgi:hypothetical protein
VGAVSVPVAHGRGRLTVATKKWKAQKDKRDGRQFLALPLVVLQSAGYRAAGHVARSLLLDIAMQYSGTNNGRLTACAKYLRPLGWLSNDTIVRARRELIDVGLLVETRKGARPNRAAWFALSWVALDVKDGLEIDPKLYRTGAYRGTDANGATLAPSGGAGGGSIAPSGGARASSVAPPGGAIRGALPPAATPSGGAYLEIPSAPAAAGALPVLRIDALTL